MFKSDRLINNRIIQNVLIWFFFYIILAVSINGTSNRFVSALVTICALAPSVYLQNFRVLPFLKEHTLKFIVYTLLNGGVFALGLCLLINAVNSVLKFSWQIFLPLFGFHVLALLIGVVFKIARDSFVHKQKEKEAELKLLKAQLNPHFLFNTLNNLYGLSVIKSDKLPGLMLQLSNLLRYSLYETKEEAVSLEKEIQYLENYVALEKIRLENTSITLEKNGSYLDKEIAPMLFIVFVENAFKHLGGEVSKVNITINIEADKIHFICGNTIDKEKPIEKNIETGKSGIGLQNAKQRLQLLYPKKHKLTIEEKSNSYLVDLMLEL